MSSINNTIAGLELAQIGWVVSFHHSMDNRSPWLINLPLRHTTGLRLLRLSLQSGGFGDLHSRQQPSAQGFEHTRRHPILFGQLRERIVGSPENWSIWVREKFLT